MTSPKITTTEMGEIPVVKKIKFKKSVKALAKTIKDDAELGKLVRKILHRERIVKVAKNAKKSVDKKRKEKNIPDPINLSDTSSKELTSVYDSEFKKECLYCGDTFIASHMNRLYCPRKHNRKDYCKTRYKISLKETANVEEYEKGKSKHALEKS